MEKRILIFCIFISTMFNALAQQGRSMPITVNGDTVFTLVEEPPTYIGGDKELSTFLSEQINFSKIKSEKCNYTIAIGKTGQVLEVKKLIGGDQNEAQLITALNQTTEKWSAGKQNGHAVNVYVFVTMEISNKHISATFSKQKAEPPENRIVDNSYEKGKIKDNYKAGVWEYYDQPGELAMKINYTSAQLLYVKPDTSWYVIKVNDRWEIEKLDVYPRYIGTMHDFKKIDDNFQYPKEAMEKNTCGKFYITFEVDTLGQAGNYAVIDDIGDNCAEAIVAFLQSLPNYWLVAKKDGKNYVSKFIIPVTFSISVDGHKISPNRKKTKQELPPVAKQLDEIVIQIMEITRTEKVRGF